MNRTISKLTTNKTRKCRYCEKLIYPQSMSIVLEQVHISPHRHDLHFHPGCWKKMLEYKYEI